MKKLFLVASVSSNCNSFGLRGMILMARDGETWQVGANSLNVKEKGDALAVPMTPAKMFTYDGDLANWSGFGFEIPRRLPDAPSNVVEEVLGPFLHGAGFVQRANKFKSLDDAALAAEAKRLAGCEGMNERLRRACLTSILEIQIERGNEQPVKS